MILTLFKIFILFILFVGIVYTTNYYGQSFETELAMKQLDTQYDQTQVKQELAALHFAKSLQWFVSLCGLTLLGFTMFWKDIKTMLKNIVLSLTCIALIFTCVGCYRPFEPVKLEVISTNEEGFLLPYNIAVDKQSSTHTEEYLEKNLVHTQQVKIPQQWVPLGYEYFGPNGEWRDAAVLIQIDKTPVTREWTADTATGTSNKNEAIWVMTSDQVEFSTGWTCTARIGTRTDAVKFLHNYKNKTLAQVLDQEVRAKLQSEFALEVTDLPMDELRKDATPHIKRVVADVTKFFSTRGIEITNLGITGGFVYKNPTISDTLVKVFNSEQDKNIAISATQRQEEENKRIQLEADAKAKAILTEKEGEAKGIKAVADAKEYEIQKAKENLETYLELKKLEVDMKRLEKWDGRFPTYFMGGGASPDILLQMPAPQLPVKAK